MTETTNPLPDDPAGATAQPQDSHLVDGSQALLDGGSTGTEEGPAGVPAALVGHDADGDPVAPPPAARPAGQSGQETDTGPGSEADPMSPADTASPLATSAGRGDSADTGVAGSSTSGGAPTASESVRGSSAS